MFEQRLTLVGFPWKQVTPGVGALKTGNCCFNNSHDRCGAGDGFGGGRAAGVGQLGAGVWRVVGPRGFNPTDMSHQAWGDLLG